MYVVCIDVLPFSCRASKEAEQRIFSCRKTASAQHNRSLLLQKVKLPWLQHHSVTQWKWSELILRERHGTPMCPTRAEFTLDNFFGSFSMPCAACSKCYATNSMLWFYFWQFLKHDKNDEAGRLRQTSVLAQSSCAWCSDTPLLQTSCLPSGESMWICSFFLSVTHLLNGHHFPLLHHILNNFYYCFSFSLLLTVLGTYTQLCKLYFAL